MSARERAVEAIRAADGPAQLGGEALLDALEDAGLRVIEQPEPPYDVTVTGPVWQGDGFAVLAREDGSLLVETEPPLLPGSVLTLTPRVAAAISAAHIRAEDYR